MVDRRKQAYLSLNRQAATGVDGQTWEGYGANLQENLQELHRRIHTGSYHLKPSRRIWIPKPDGRQRPINWSTMTRLIQRWVPSVSIVHPYPNQRWSV